MCDAVSNTVVCTSSGVSEARAIASAKAMEQHFHAVHYSIAHCMKVILFSLTHTLIDSILYFFI